MEVALASERLSQRVIKPCGSRPRAQVWDLRKVEVALTLRGHTDTVTGLRVSPDGTHLLSNAMVRAIRRGPPCLIRAHPPSIARCAWAEGSGGQRSSFKRDLSPPPLPPTVLCRQPMTAGKGECGGMVGAGCW